MGYLVNPIAELLQDSFVIIPDIGMNMDISLCIVGGIATLIWIGLMLKYEKQEVANR